MLMAALCSPLSAAEKVQSPEAPGKARNVILFIGDGLGINMLSAARAYSVGADGRLQMEQLPHMALAHTCAEDKAVTDSASSASSLATGFKVPYRSLNIRGNGNRPALISELAHKSGRSVGIVTNTRLTDATPAAFYGDTKNRYNEVELVPQLVESHFDVILGGGLAWFLPKTTPPGIREDGQDYLAKARVKGWAILQTRDDLKKSEQLPAGSRLLGVFTTDDMSYVDERKGRPAEPPLTEMTLAAIHRLSKNPKGYFLMVEGGMIDKAEHKNWALRSIMETLEFDQTIGAVLREAGKDTLVIVTADHETGGFALSGSPPLSSHGNELLARQPDQGFLMGWTSGPGALQKQSVDFLDPNFRQPAAHYTSSALHTANDVFVAATGPGSEDVHGFFDNTEIFRIMKRALGL